MVPVSVTGAVLAGGRSSRMGTDKGGLEVDGETLLDRQLRLLASAGVSERLVAVAASQGIVLPEGVGRVTDRESGLGPLAGIECCLAACQTDLLLVVAVDLPALTVELLRRLIAAAGRNCGVMPLRQNFAEPLVAIYPRSALAEIGDRLRRRDLKLQPLARAGIAAGWLKPWPVAAADETAFANWNRPEDLPATGFKPGDAPIAL